MGGGRRFSVLVVDESDDIANPIAEILRQNNFEAIALSQPEKCEVILAQFDIDLIVAALEMPQKNITSPDQVKKLFANCAGTIPILYTTTSNLNDRPTVGSLNARGLSAVIIEKPFRTHDDLLRPIHEILNPFMPYPQNRGDCEMRDSIYCTNDTDIVIVSQDNYLLNAIEELLKIRLYRIQRFTQDKNFLDYLAGFSGNFCVAIIDPDTLTPAAMKSLDQAMLSNPGRIGLHPLARPVNLPELADNVRQLAVDAGSLGDR